MSGGATERGDADRSFLLHGGNVDAGAVHRAYQEAQDQGDDEFLVRVRFELAHDLKSRLDRYLATRINFMSRNKLQTLIESGAVTINGRAAKASSRLRQNDAIEVVIPQPPSGEIEPDDIPLDVLYEDAHILVLNKQADIIVHPARSENRGTMLNALVHYLAQHESGELSSVGRELARPGVVHRLDRHTSGCIVFAKSDEAHWKMGDLFQSRSVGKRYLAVVEGWVEPDEQLIDLPLGPHFSHAKGSREKQIVRHDQLGKESRTICRVRERYELPPLTRKTILRRYSLVELELLTGRTHQIRVHLAHLGYPIVGDDMYKGKPLTDEAGEPLIDKPALHAARLAFAHPMTHEPLSFIAPPRAEMLRLIGFLRATGRPAPVEAAGAIPLPELGVEPDPSDR